MYIRIRFPQTGSHHHCCLGKAISITYSECVSVDLLIQHTKLMRHFVFSSVPCPVLLKFSTLSLKNFVNAWTSEHCSDPELPPRLKPTHYIMSVQPFITKRHTLYCGQARGPHVEKSVTSIHNRLNYCIIFTVLPKIIQPLLDSAAYPIWM